MCDGARQYVCWNGSTVDGPLAAQKIAADVFELYEKLPDFDATFRSLVNEEADLADVDRQQRLQQLRIAPEPRNTHREPCLVCRGRRHERAKYGNVCENLKTNSTRSRRRSGASRRCRRINLRFPMPTR